MSNTIVFDLIENMKGVKPTKLTLIEDLIETDENNPTLQTAIYSLYEAVVEDEKLLYIEIYSKSAHVVLPATDEMLLEYFPDHTNSAD